MNPQAETADYGSKYDSKRRFASYWHQIYEILSLRPKKVLEVGTGNGFVSRYLREKGILLTTADCDERLQPDVIADVKALPFADNSFDVVVAYEILEHMPYEDSLKALRELWRVSSAHVLLSLPDATRAFRIECTVPWYGQWRKIFVIPRLFPKVHKMTKGGHYWEIGKKDYSLLRIAGDIKDAGFAIDKTYRVFENAYHRFFILEKVI